jgi:hypothetical protein
VDFESCLLTVMGGDKNLDDCESASLIESQCFPTFGRLSVEETEMRGCACEELGLVAS